MPWTSEAEMHCRGEYFSSLGAEATPQFGGRLKGFWQSGACSREQVGPRWQCWAAPLTEPDRSNSPPNPIPPVSPARLTRPINNQMGRNLRLRSQVPMPANKSCGVPTMRSHTRCLGSKSIGVAAPVSRNLSLGLAGTHLSKSTAASLVLVWLQPTSVHGRCSR